MKTINSHENFPIWIVTLSSLASIMTYGLGFLVMYRLGRIFSLLYLAFALLLEYRLIRYHCINCYYWGKRCGFGKGLVSSLFFKRGDNSKFCTKDMSWKDLIPDLLLTLIPIATGIFLLIAKFDIILLTAIIVLLILATAGNQFIRGKLTCRYCKQRELGCPAEKLFNK